MSLKLVLVFKVMMIGRWSEFKACFVVHVERGCRVEDIEVMSGEVCFWLAACGIRVGVFVLSVMWSEFCMMSEIKSPRWSVVGECHSVEWAFMSPVRIEFGSDVMYSMQVVMSVSSFCGLVIVVFRGGMYMLAIWRSLCCDR